MIIKRITRSFRVFNKFYNILTEHSGVHCHFIFQPKNVFIVPIFLNILIGHSRVIIIYMLGKKIIIPKFYNILTGHSGVHYHFICQAKKIFIVSKFYNILTGHSRVIIILYAGKKNVVPYYILLC